MKKILCALMLVICIFFAGCDKTGTPDDLMGTMYTAFKKNDFQKWSKNLSGDAAKQFGTQAGYGSLRAMILNLRTNGYAIDMPHPRFKNKEASTFSETVVRYYTEVSAYKYAESNLLFTAEILCDTKHELEHIVHAGREAWEDEWENVDTTRCTLDKLVSIKK